MSGWLFQTDGAVIPLVLRLPAHLRSCSIRQAPTPHISEHVRCKWSDPPFVALSLVSFH